MSQQVLIRDPPAEAQAIGRTLDGWALLCMIHYIQEVEKPYEPGPYRGIADGELMYRLGWSRIKFEAVLHQSEDDPRLIKTPSGGYALTW